MKLILLYSIQIVCIICAATLAIYGKSGWGWFLFVACLVFPTSREMEEDKPC